MQDTTIGLAEDARLQKELLPEAHVAVGEDKHVFITDPEGFRVIEFTENGEFVRTWGDLGTGPDQIGLAAGIAVDQEGFVWVTDAVNNRILRYTLPE